MGKGHNRLALRPPAVALVGLVASAVATMLYTYEERFMTFVTPERAAFFGWVAWTYLIVLLVGAALLVFDVRRLIGGRSKVESEQGFAPVSPGWIIPHLISVRRYRRFFAVSSALYGVFYAAITSMVVYQPSVDFAQAYGATFPSVVVTPCCGGPLYSPILTVYLADHLGLLLFPLTMVLGVVIPLLVGLNFSMAAFAFDSRARAGGRSWLGGMGAVVGLFTGCPSCAGLFFASAIGGAGAVEFTALLAAYQPVFIALSLPVLVVTLYLTSRSLAKVYAGGCVWLSSASGGTRGKQG